MIERRCYRIELSDGQIHTIPEEFMFGTEEEYRKKYENPPPRVNVFNTGGEKCHFDPKELVNG